MEYTIIGQVINTQGIKGEIKIRPLTNDLNRFSKLQTVYLGDNKEKLTYEKSRIQKNFIIMKLKEYNNINDVLKFKEGYIYVDSRDRVELEEDEFFISDLLDSVVYNMDREKLGILIDVREGIGNDIYIIKGSGPEFMVPAVKEFIKKIDLENKEIFIDPIEGMIP